MESYLTLYIDGSCINNGKKNAKGGIGLYIDTNLDVIKKKEISINSIKIKNCVPTNQKTELMAMLIALNIIQRITQYNIDFICTIFTDSKYVLNCVTQWISNWEKNRWITSNKQKIKNEEIIKNIANLLHKLNNQEIKYLHINSHQPKPDKNDENFRHWYGNNMADKLARSAALKIK